MYNTLHIDKLILHSDSGECLQNCVRTLDVTFLCRGGSSGFSEF